MVSKNVAPINGLDRCPCGCKYWVKKVVARKIVHICFDCGSRFDYTDVHTSHCCAVHGCKYNDDDCSVAVLGRPAEYPDSCEYCQWTHEEVATFLPQATNAELVAELSKRSAQVGWMSPTGNLYSNEQARDWPTSTTDAMVPVFA